MNVGYEEDELKPYIEPQPDYKDPRRTGRNASKAVHLFVSLEHRCSFFSTHTQR